MTRTERRKTKRTYSAVFLRALRLNFILVAAIGVCLVLLSLRMSDSMRKNEMANCRSTLEYGLAQLDAQLESVSQNILSFRELIMEQSPDGLHRYDAVNLLKAKSTLENLVCNSPLVGEIAYVNEKRDMVVTSQSVFYSIDSFLKGYEITGMPTEPFYTYLLGNERLATVRFYPCTAVSGRYVPAFECAFCCSIPLDMDRYTTSKGVAFVFLRRQELTDLAVSEYIHPYASLHLYDNRAGRGDVCLMSEMDALDDGFETVLLNGSETLRAEIHVSNRYISEQMQSVNRFILGILAAVVGVGVAMALWTAYRQYLPMRNVIRSLREQNLLISSDRNEYTELLSSVSTLIDEKEIVAQMLDDYQESLQRNLLDRLFSNALLQQDVEVMLRMQMEEFPARFSVYCGRLFVGRADSNDTMQMTLVMMLDFLKRSLPANAILHSTDTTAFGLVYPCEDGVEAAEERLRQTLFQASERFSVHVLLVCGGVCESMSQIGACYEKAQMSPVRDYSQYLSEGVAILPLPEEREQKIRIRQIQTLCQMITSGNADRAVEEMRAIYESTCGLERINTGERYTTLRACLLMTCPEIQEEMPYPEIPSFRTGMPRTKQLEALEKAVREMCAWVNDWQASAMDDRFGTFTDYIQANFADPELCVSSLANEFHVSEKYLYSLFKKKTGCSPTNYLHQIRMQEAAARLREGNDTVQDISAQVGFANFGTFYKAFKRTFGVAPGKFREQARSEA